MGEALTTIPSQRSTGLPNVYILRVEHVLVKSTEIISVSIGLVHTLSSVVIKSRRLQMTVVHIHTISGAT